jgi:hypothetical protein
MRRAVWSGGVIAVLAASTFVVSAQGGGKPISGGNPTPGTAQPDPPNLSDRIMLTGCLQPAPKSGTNTETPDSNTPSNEHFVLSDARRVDRLPPGTGGSELAAKTSSRSYRLEGIDSQFSPFVNMKVEISGEIKPTPAGDTAGSNVPTLLVEFIQKTAPTCQP